MVRSLTLNRGRGDLLPWHHSRTAAKVKPMEFDRNGLEVLGRDECLRLLTGSTLGRIGVTSGALPVILPVNFMVRDEHIFIRTGKGTKLDTATRNSVVVFEVDDFEAFDHSGWSVLVTGIARNAGPSAASLSLAHAPPRWAPSPEEERVISISIDLISGRRITIDAFAALVESGLDTSD